MTVRFRIIIGGRKKVLQSGFHTNSRKKWKFPALQCIGMMMLLGGGCRVPKSWKIYYKDASGNWTPVQNITAYGVQKGNPNTVDFEPVKTKAVKLEVVQPDKNSSGLYEWGSEITMRINR